MKRMPVLAAMAACVLFLLSMMGRTSLAADTAPPPATALILSVSWQPGFCETRRTRTECRSQKPDAYEATHFTLHGLWPMRRSYCGVDAATKELDRTGKWTELAPVAVDADLAARLDRLMPGRRSGLDRHQWLRSGTCTGLAVADYFALQSAFLDKLNTSPVRDLFVGRLGKPVTAREVRAAFDAGFGAGSGERLRLTCRKAGERQVITGLTIGLGALPQQAASGPLADLVLKAAATPEKCAEAIVDAAGFETTAAQ